MKKKPKKKKPALFMLDGVVSTEAQVRGALASAGADPDLAVHFADGSWWQELCEKTGCSWKTAANQNVCVGKDGSVKSEGPGKGEKVGKLHEKLGGAKKAEARGKDVGAAKEHLDKAKAAHAGGDAKGAGAWLGTAHARLASATKGSPESGKGKYHQTQAKSFLESSKAAAERGDVKKALGLASQAHQHADAMHRADSKKK